MMDASREEAAPGQSIWHRPVGCGRSGLAGGVHIECLGGRHLAPGDHVDVDTNAPASLITR